VTIVGHSDTVWPLGSVIDPRLYADPDGSRWAGPGIGDMKAALLLAADAAEAAAASLTDAAPGVIRILVVPDEEVGSVGSSTAISRIADDTDLCIGLEAGKPDGSFITSRGAVGAIRIDVHGSAAHVTDPSGINALDPMLDVLSRIRTLDLDDVQISITQLDGGTARQITAANASTWLDLRSDSGTSMAAAVDSIGHIVASVQRDSAADVRMSGGQTRPAFPLAAAQHPWSLLRGVAADDHPVTAVHERGGSDASTFADRGVPTIDGFGPVCFDNCAPGESISIESVGARADLMAALITRWSEAHA
jgi:glutamate carboxypeptidase